MLPLYALVGACWLPERYRRYARWWFALGWPAFIGVLAIFWLMVFHPDL